MSLYGLPKYEWPWEFDALIRHHPLNRHVRDFIVLVWPLITPPTLDQIKARRKALKNLDRVNEFRIKNGEPLLDRPHTPKAFDEQHAYLLGTLPDSMLAHQLGVPSQTVRAARLERKIPSYKETRHAAYDPEMEEDMLQTVKRIALLLPEDTLDKACLILHRTDPVWIKQCLEKLERKNVHQES